LLKTKESLETTRKSWKEAARRALDTVMLRRRRPTEIRQMENKSSWLSASELGMIIPEYLPTFDNGRLYINDHHWYFSVCPVVACRRQSSREP
jgi:hypothetical protein